MPKTRSSVVQHASSRSRAASRDNHLSATSTPRQSRSSQRGRDAAFMALGDAESNLPESGALTVSQVNTTDEAKPIRAQLASPDSSSNERSNHAPSPPVSETGSTSVPAHGERTVTLAPQDEHGNTRLPAPSDARLMTATPEPLTDLGMQVDGKQSDDDAPRTRLEEMEFRVLLPMSGQASDHYRRTITFNKDLVRALAEDGIDSDAHLLEADQLIQDLLKTTTHVDLLNTSAAEIEGIPAFLQAQSDIGVSSKFRFFAGLLDFLRQQPLQIVVLTPPGRLGSMLARILEWKGIKYQIWNREQQSAAPLQCNELAVAIITTDCERVPQLPRQVRLLLSFDPDLDMESNLVIQLRSLAPKPPVRLPPVVSLAVRNSIDHVIRFVHPAYDKIQRMVILLKASTDLRKHAGRGSHDPLSAVKEAAENVGRFVLMQGDEEAWPFPRVEETDNREVWAMIGTDRTGPSKPPRSPASPNSQKRRLHSSSPFNAHKRIRVNSRSDSEKSFGHTGAFTKSSSSTQSTRDYEELKRKLLESEAKCRVKDDQLAQQHEHLLRREAQCNELSQDIEELQLRYDDLRIETTANKKTHVGLQNDIDVMRRQRDRREETVTSLKQQNTLLKANLEASTALAKGSVVPEVAELATMREQLANITEEAARYKRKASDSESTFGVLQRTYADAGLRMSELQEENERLSAAVHKLEQRAKGERIRAAEITRDQTLELMATEIKRLRAMLDQREGILKRKEDELKSRRITMGTRAGSVPRSPRVGPSSRAASPIPDRRIGVLKNNYNLPSRRYLKPNAKLADEIPEPPQQIGVLDQITSSPRLQQGSPSMGNGLKIQGAPEVEVLRLEEPVTQEPSPSHSQQATTPVISQQEASRSTPTKVTPSVQRPFPCTFAPYGCAAAFSSKNEWKRHISTKHIQLGFWRCDMCPPSPGIDAPVYNDFNRKDLFTQHLRRMHGGLPATNPGSQPKEESQERGSLPAGSPNPNNLTLNEDQITEIQKRCYRQTRLAPQHSGCIFCVRFFEGSGSWEERLEHVGGHLERDRKNNSVCPSLDDWREDPPLREYLLQEGIIEVDPRGGYRIGDNKPRHDGSQIPPGLTHEISSTLSMGGTTPDQSPSQGSRGSGLLLDATEGAVMNSRARKRGRPTRREPSAAAARRRNGAEEHASHQQQAGQRLEAGPVFGEQRELRPKITPGQEASPYYFYGPPPQHAEVSQGQAFAPQHAQGADTHMKNTAGQVQKQHWNNAIPAQVIGLPALAPAPPQHQAIAPAHKPQAGMPLSTSAGAYPSSSLRQIHQFGPPLAPAPPQHVMQHAHIHHHHNQHQHHQQRQPQQHTLPVPIAPDLQSQSSQSHSMVSGKMPDDAEGELRGPALTSEAASVSTTGVPTTPIRRPSHPQEMKLLSNKQVILSPPHPVIPHPQDQQSNPSLSLSHPLHPLHPSDQIKSAGSQAQVSNSAPLNGENGQEVGAKV